jgi:hypothetical protein
MNWEKVGRAIADSAPILGGLLGGPAGGAAGALIASTLGTAADPEAVLAKIQSDPAVLIQIKQIEADERESVRAWQTETLKAELSDVQSARLTHASHWMPSAITIGLGLMTTAIVWALLYFPIPDNNRDLAINYGGQIIGLFCTSVAYWIGTSRSSANKDQALLSK